MPPRSLDAWLALLETRHPATIELGLDRIRRVQAAMALPRPAPRIITVAGTNGKGSTVACLAALLRARGWRTGTYTSPHLRHFRERALVDDGPFDDSAWCGAFERVERALGEVSLTYFEFTTLAAFDLFARSGLEVAVLEVGLGGRLDAVNAIDPDVAVVTRIALDHRDWLGDTLEAIAAEKAGIFRPGIPAICGQADPPEALQAAATALGAPWLCRDRDFTVRRHAEGLWCWRGRTPHGPTGLTGLPAVQVPLDSAATALQVLAWQGWLPETAMIPPVLAAVVVPGRFQCTAIEGIPLVLDVAHNPDAATWLAERLANPPHSGRTLAIFAALGDKDIAGIIQPLLPCVDAWLVADLPGVPRAAPVRRLADALASAGVTLVSLSRNPRQALARARQLATPDDRIVVFGSFYTVGEVLAALEG